MRNLLPSYVCFLIAVSGVRAAVTPGTETDFALSLALGMTVALCCVVDGRALRRPMVPSFHWVIMFTWHVSAPIYLIWSRGLAGLAVALILAITFIVMYAIAFNITYMLLHAP